jgi:hypothetical protein
MGVCASLITLFFIGLITDIINAASILDTLLVMAPNAVFYPERALATVNIRGLFDLFYHFGVSLIVIKFLKSGFETYIMWQAGDPDQDPLQFLLGFVKAMVVALCFTPLYDLLAGVTGDLTSRSMDILTSRVTPPFTETLLQIVATDIFKGFGALVAVVCYCILMIQFFMRGIELLVMRVGLPLACVGLLDADRGVFGPYMKKFFQNAATVLVQLVLLKLSVVIMDEAHFFYSIAIAVMAIKTPRFLAEFFIVQGGGGLLGSVYHATQLVSSVRRMIR